MGPETAHHEGPACLKGVQTPDVSGSSCGIRRGWTVTGDAALRGSSGTQPSSEEGVGQQHQADPAEHIWANRCVGAAGDNDEGLGSGARAGGSSGQSQDS